MSSNYFVVDHISDERKTDGILESYQMIPVQYEQGGQLVSGMKRMNFVHWPEIPNPVVHEEWSEDLVFSNIYIPELDAGEDEEEEEEEEEEEDGDGVPYAEEEE